MTTQTIPCPAETACPAESEQECEAALETKCSLPVKEKDLSVRKLVVARREPFQLG